MAFASVRTSDSSPVLVILDAEPDFSSVPFATTADCSSGGSASGCGRGIANAKDSANATANANPIRETNSIANATASANGEATAVANAKAYAVANAYANADGNAKAEGNVVAFIAGASAAMAAVEEVELSTRCCSKNVVSANPHAVWVNPAEVKVFLSRRDGGVSAAASRSEGMVVAAEAEAGGGGALGKEAADKAGAIFDATARPRSKAFTSGGGGKRGGRGGGGAGSVARSTALRKIETSGPIGGKEGRHLRTRLVQTVAEGKPPTS